jgi:hypothetical protein
LDATAAKYNANEKLTVTGTLETIGPAKAQWLSDDFTTEELDHMLLTPRSGSVNSAGTYLISLALKRNRLIAGATYSFTLAATYDMDTTPMEIDKFETVTVVMNSPPSIGSIDCEVAIQDADGPTGELKNCDVDGGTALQDVYTITANNFEDDVDDLPLKYLVAVWDSINSKTMLKGFDATKYVQTKLGAGFEDNGFVRNVGITAKDKFGATSSTASKIIVRQLSEEELQAAADAMMEEAFANSDPAEVQNAAAAAASQMNVKSCNLPALPNGAADCAGIGREACEDGNTDDVCGKCLDGLTGPDGDGISPCIDLSVVVPAKVGDVCVSDSDCFTNYCFDSKCS